MTTEIPLIWTNKGNLPTDSLKYETSWEVLPEYIKFIEQYYYEEELVKSSTHVYTTNKFEEIVGEQQSF